jgi:hypothetical protein
MSTERPLPDGTAAPSADPAPPRTDRFRSWVGVTIAVVSILGAVVVWRASVESSNASDLTQQGTQSLILVQQKQSSIEAGVARDFRLFTDFQEHVMDWRLLLKQADKVADDDPDLAAQLRAQARRELSQARHIRPLIQNFDRPDYGDENGVAEFDPERQVRALAGADLELTGLRPAAAFAKADAAHDHALQLVGIAVLFGVALLFLTFAQVARRGARGIFAVAGVAVMLGASLLFLLVVMGS